MIVVYFRARGDQDSNIDVWSFGDGDLDLSAGDCVWLVPGTWEHLL